MVAALQTKVKAAVVSEWEAEETNRVRLQLAVKGKTLQAVVHGKSKRKCWILNMPIIYLGG